MMERCGLIWPVSRKSISSLVDRITSTRDEFTRYLKLAGVMSCGIYDHASRLFSYFEIENILFSNASNEKKGRNLFEEPGIKNFQSIVNEITGSEGIVMNNAFFTPGFQEEDIPYQRVASYMKIKPGFEEAYCSAHANIWPSILEGIQKTKIRNYSIFIHDTHLYSYFEVKDLDLAYSVLAEDPENQRWQRVMAPMMDVGSKMEEGSSDTLNEIWHF